MLEQFVRRFRGWLGASEADRRVWVRYPCEIETTCEPAHRADPLKLQARVKNISQGGITLEVPHCFEVGNLLNVNLSGQDDESASNVVACILHVRKLADEQWSLGCIFAVELEQDDLLPFGASRQLASPVDKRTWVRFKFCGDV